MNRYRFTLHPADVHIIGFSFGAQVAGFFGRNFKKSTGTTIWRITALDPAGPLFNDTDVYVCKKDATFVDVIHTSGGYGIGYVELGLLRPTQVDDEICYERVGCFSSRDRFTLPTSFPDDPETVNTSLMLFSRTNRQDPVFLDYTFTSRQENTTNWRTNRPLKIIVHGWRDNTNSSWIHDMKDALLQEDDCNVIIVDWSRGAKTLNYVFAAGNSALVGRQLSLLTQRLLKVYGLNASRVHCIGHSLGGHAAGFFGRHFKKKTGLLIGRISALDVAEPLFSDSGVSVCSEDAQFVDVIHTSEGHWYIRSGLGITKPVGHVDFYPNFGERQPGCPLMDIICDHDRSVYYFMESITNKQCHFKSKPFLLVVAVTELLELGSTASDEFHKLEPKISSVIHFRPMRISRGASGLKYTIERNDGSWDDPPGHAASGGKEAQSPGRGIIPSGQSGAETGSRSQSSTRNDNSPSQSRGHSNSRPTYGRNDNPADQLRNQTGSTQTSPRNNNESDQSRGQRKSSNSPNRTSGPSSESHGIAGSTQSSGRNDGSIRQSADQERSN
ncbi:hypothetical protein HPB47_011702, partial [Ixodes persulcatus]